MTRHPETITTDEQFEATEFEVGVIYDDTDTPNRKCRYELTAGGRWMRTPAGSPNAKRSEAGAPRFFLPLTLVSEPETTAEPTTEFKTGDRVEYIESRPEHMTGLQGTVIEAGARAGSAAVAWDEGARYPRTHEPTHRLSLVTPPEPVISEVTDEQRAAVEWLRRTMNIQLEPHAGILFDLLPSELTAPKHEMPKEPGLYVDKRGQAGPVWRVKADGSMGQVGGYANPDSSLAPFRRLVVEREPITREHVGTVLRNSGRSYVDQTDAILALVNRED